MRNAARRRARGVRLITTAAVVGALITTAAAAPASAATATPVPFASASAGSDSASSTSAAATTTDQFVVTTTGATPSVRTLNAQVGDDVTVTATRTITPGIAVVTLAAPVSKAKLAAATRALTAAKSIGSATPNVRFHSLGTAAPVASKDQYSAGQWDLWDARSTVRAGGYGVDAARAWTVSKGSSEVTVAVLDTGTTPHTDLTNAHTWAGYDFVTNTTGNNAGANVYSYDGDSWDSDPTDTGDICPDQGYLSPSSWHGTFTADEIVGSHGSAYDVAGLAPGVSYEPVRVLGGCGGSLSDIIAGITWASGGSVTGVTTNAHPADVISMSLGVSLGSSATCASSTDPYDFTSLRTAISDAIGRGTTIVAAAGNDSAAISSDLPAGCPGVISVAATTREGTLASYSNHGTAATPVTVAAPGGDDDDPVLGDTWDADGVVGPTAASFSLETDDVTTAEGTSMAAPRVAAAAALLLSTNATLREETGSARVTAVTAALRKAVTPFASTSACATSTNKVRCGTGIVNVGNLLGAKRYFVVQARPTVSGTRSVGKVLHASAGRFGPQSGTGSTRTYAWLRNGTVITGATTADYQLRAADRGTTISVRVTISRDNYVSLSSRSAGVRIATR